MRTGDIISLGSGPAAPRFRVELLDGGQHPSTALLDEVLRRYTQPQLQPLPPRSQGLGRTQPQVQGGGVLQGQPLPFQPQQHTARLRAQHQAPNLPAPPLQPPQLPADMQCPPDTSQQWPMQPPARFTPGPSLPQPWSGQISGSGPGSAAGLSLQQLATLARRSPAAAEAGYQAALLGKQRANPIAWLSWAQVRSLCSIM